MGKFWPTLVDEGRAAVSLHYKVSMVEREGERESEGESDRGRERVR